VGTPPRNFEILQALQYMFWGFWGSFLCLHTVHIYLCRALASGLRSSHIRECVRKFVSAVYWTRSKKPPNLKSTMQWNKPFKEARLRCEWWTGSYLNKFGGPLTPGVQSKLSLLPPTVDGTGYECFPCDAMYISQLYPRHHGNCICGRGYQSILLIFENILSKTEQTAMFAYCQVC